jgi:DNA-binding transcriptional ArsR family regulator
MYSAGVARHQHRDAVDPPAFLHAAGHPVRWQLLSELAASDRQVRELTALIDQPQNLVSYHLGLLRKAELVGTRRSTADGRDIYYRLDLARCGDLLTATGAALHPALRMTRPPPPPHVRASVLFLCTGNSSRSQMAEVLLRRAAGSTVEVSSAGSHPKPVHPSAIRLFPELSDARPKHLDEYTGRHFNHVITLCMPDPAREPDGLPAFVRTATELDERIGFLLHRITAHQPSEAS